MIIIVSMKKLWQIKGLSKSDESALRNVSPLPPKNKAFYVLTDSAPPILSLPRHPKLISSGMALAMLIESHHI